MIEMLVEHPLLLLFVVAGLGYPLGRIKVGGSSLGVAAVLFVGLAIGALDERLKLPEIIYTFGLLLFVYTVGLSSGPGFFASFRGKGLRDNLFVAGVIVCAGALLVGLHYALGLQAAETAGLLAGGLTNTPALAGILEYLKRIAAPESLQALPVVAYSLAYPVSVLGMIIALALAQRLWRVDFAAEQRGLNQPGTVEIMNETVLVTSPPADGANIKQLAMQHGWNVVFGRYKRGADVELARAELVLQPGDLLTVVGDPAHVSQVVQLLGQASDEHIELDRSEIDYRRIFVSNPRVAGHRLRDLNLPQQFGAMVTRVRRGDIELIPHGNTMLELGDRVRVVTRRENMPAVSTFFGDSYRALSEIDILSFSLGVALGMLLGMVPIPLPGGITIRLGLAGGPLVAALVLGTLGRTGPIVWSLPYSANLMLRQIGLVCFLAGVGTRSGYAFVETLTQGNGLLLLGVAAAVVTLSALLMLWIGYKLLRIPFGILSGMIAGMQTQPATLGFAQEQSGNELPNIGYATVFPVAMVVKIVLAQLLLLLLA